MSGLAADLGAERDIKKSLTRRLKPYISKTQTMLDAKKMRLPVGKFRIGIELDDRYGEKASVVLLPALYDQGKLLSPFCSQAAIAAP